MFFYKAKADAKTESALLFQSPEGDSLFFYTRIWIDCNSLYVFQSPEGDSLFFYEEFDHRMRLSRGARECFSPPKGIHCFSTY